MIKIAPSILSANFAYLADEIRKVETAGADMLHIDVMDGHFVPNITFGPPVVAALRKVTNLPFDVHLMIDNPQDYIDSFAQAGADMITVHTEATCHVHRLIQQIKSRDIQAGISLNPGTPLSCAEELFNDVDMILLMTVNPGFGGQKFINSSISKIKRLKELITQRGLTIDIEVDGGINTATAAPVIEAGATILVAGSAVYGAADIAAAVSSLRGA
jgi:ribulose-phosphate 3-epimerase